MSKTVNSYRKTRIVTTNLSETVSINLLIYFLSEKELLVMINEDKRRIKSRRYFFLIDSIISPSYLYQLSQRLMKNVETFLVLYSERKNKLSGDIEIKPGPQVNFKALTK